MITTIKENKGIIAWIFFGFVVGLCFFLLDQSRQESRRQICQSQLDTALTIRDLIDFSIEAVPNQTPDTQAEAREIVQKFYDRLELPPKICEGTNIDIEEFFRRDEALRE